MGLPRVLLVKCGPARHRWACLVRLHMRAIGERLGGRGKEVLAAHVERVVRRRLGVCGARGSGRRGHVEGAEEVDEPSLGGRVLGGRVGGGPCMNDEFRLLIEKLLDRLGGRGGGGGGGLGGVAARRGVPVGRGVKGGLGRRRGGVGEDQGIRVGRGMRGGREGRAIFSPFPLLVLELDKLADAVLVARLWDGKVLRCGGGHWV